MNLVSALLDLLDDPLPDLLDDPLPDLLDDPLPDLPDPLPDLPDDPFPDLPDERVTKRCPGPHPFHRGSSSSDPLLDLLDQRFSTVLSPLCDK
jgi:hypothetical protein